jgi:hypothetical protein
MGGTARQYSVPPVRIPKELDSLFPLGYIPFMEYMSGVGITMQIAHGVCDLIDDSVKG